MPVRDLAVRRRLTDPRDFDPPAPMSDRPASDPPPMPPGIRPAQRLAPLAATAITLTTPPPEVIAINKITFGVKPGESDRVKSIGLTAFFEEQLNPEGIDDSACDARLAAQNYQTLAMDVPTLWARRLLQESSDQWRGYMEVLTGSLIRAIYSRRQLFELVVDHWHNHFNVYGPSYPTYFIWPDYHRRIRKNAFGNFRTFLEDIATSPAMLYYLDNSSNKVSGPNENYARELFELHGLGVAAYKPGISAPDLTKPYDGYRDWDVYEAARCLTGWTIGTNGDFSYRADWHDRFGKYVLNAWINAEQPPMQDGKDVLDRVARHPATAKNVATRLVRRLVSDVPPTNIVNAATQTFLDNLDAPDQLRKVVRTIVTHPDLLNYWGTKIRRPFEAIVGAIRAVNGEWTWTNTFDWQWGLVGQQLFEWSPPNGYPDVKEAWNSTTYLLRRWNFINYLCNDDIDGTTVNLANQMPADRVTTRQIVEYWADRLLGYRISPTEMQPLIDFLGRGRNPESPLPANEYLDRRSSLVALIISSPQAQLR